MIITYPFMTVIDDSGAVVAGATVTVASVTDKAGTAVASPGATVNLAGANVSVDYDAEAKGEAWITLSVSKAGSVFTGLNAAPVMFAARDSGRVNALPATGSLAATTGDAYARLGAPTGSSVSADVAANAAALATANASLAATAGLFVAGTVSAATGPNSFTVNFTAAVLASDLVNLLCCVQGADHRPAKATITGAVQVDSTHVVLAFNPPFSNAPAVNDSVLVG